MKGAAEHTESEPSMELSSLLHDLHLSPSSSSEKPLPSASLPPITELLSRLQEADWWAELQVAYSSVSALIGCALCRSVRTTPPLCPLGLSRHPDPSGSGCSALTARWELCGNVGGQSGVLLSVCPPVCVFSVTHFQDRPWTSPASRAAARSLQEALLRAGRWRDSAHLLTGDEENRGMLGEILDVLQPQLSKDVWTRCEAVKFVFAWTLLQVTRPSLSPHLSRLLPPSLLLNDHYRPENCMLGVHCLHHIVLNTTPADLRQFNRAEVVYGRFQTPVHVRGCCHAGVLPGLLDLLAVLEKPPSSLGPSSSHRKPCRHDDVLRLMLTHMEAENKVALRRVYAAALPPYVDRMGVAVCRHLRRLERVVLGYLEVRDSPEETSRLKMLEVLEKSIRTAWPRMACRVDVLLRCLLKLLLDVSVDSGLSDSVRQQLTNQTSLCIKLLDGCSHGDVQRLLEQIDSSCCSSEVLCCLATVTTRTGR
ncbi:TELO2-interacting protein 2 [Larimichthys crocea]|uniref:TELO2-interacting protein 2 n=1 Tax=Larimichthys crocea TaxID=215358 RepID=A0A6G0IMR5_LARCR|nr:TELO2-interacting protein 2 [Larimichthys crocea]